MRNINLWRTVIVWMVMMIVPVWVAAENQGQQKEIPIQQMTDQEAIEMLAEVINSGKLSGQKLADAYLKLAVVIGHGGDLNGAIVEINKAIETDPDYAQAYLVRGSARMAQKEWDNAIEDYTRAIEISPELADAYVGRAVCLKKKSEYDKAIEDYSQVLKLNPRDVEVYIDRGNTWLRLEEPDKALSDFNKAIGLNPDYAMAYYNRAGAWQRKGDLEKAMADMEKAFSLEPDRPIIKFGMSKLEMDIKNQKSAQSSGGRTVENQSPPDPKNGGGTAAGQ